MERERGFTLIEILFALFVGVILMGAAYVAMSSGQRTSTGVERKVAAQQDIRAAIQAMSLEISMASYNPHVFGGFWHDLPNLGSPTPVSCASSGDQAYKGIREATATRMVIEMINDSPGNENDKQVGNQAGEIVVYNYDLQKQYITRESPLCGAPRLLGNAQSFLGEDPATGLPRAVRVINNNLENSALNMVNGAGAVAVFRYYNGVADVLNPFGKEIYPGTTPSEIPNIRRIDIILAVETDEVDPSTRSRKQMTYSSSVLVRNHALSQ
jgi:prepilin-type N-terminal cleavage/methylation domain-containing protein